MSFKDQTEIVRLLKSASGIVKLLVNRQSKEVIDLDDNEEAMVIFNLCLYIFYFTRYF